MYSKSQERQALADVSINQPLLPSAITFTNLHADPNKIFKWRRQQSLTNSFIASPMVSLTKKRSIDYIDVQDKLSQKKLKIWKNFQESDNDIDSNSTNDIKMVKEYNSDIFKYFYQREPILSPAFNYTKDKHSMCYLRPKLRTILVDWIVQVHEKFQCVSETLLLSINIMDRFLSTSKVSTSKLQLVAITSLFIASKFYEINLPKISNYAYVTDGAASIRDIKLAEYQILKALNFEIAWPNPMDFIRRISKSDNYDERTRKYAKMIIEFAYCSTLFIHLKPSLLSVLSMYIAKKMTMQSVEKDKQETEENLIKWLTPFLNNEDYHDLKDSSRIIKKYSSLLLDEIINPSMKIECLIQKFKDQNTYNDFIKNCKALKN
ncbi:uncharacterized protein PWA37_000398 [Arxiozyma heterogenica]|uniref:Cyclin N-terminal domain-containing protein n=1 Tax=Arxiozyma heterogenica TaxID=278026 RepID=A0AAN8A6A4_9SACH|nr:hypothetical protein RI543_004013 [Kazachstania heterogenica]